MGDPITAETRAFGSIPENIARNVGMSQQQALFVDQLSPRYLELARARVLYSASTGAGTAKAPYIAVPTTTATWALYNAAATHSVVVLSIHAWLVSGISGIGEFIFAGLSGVKQATAPSDYASSVKAAITPGSPISTATFANAVTLAEAPAWQMWATNGGGSADVSDSSGMSADIDGFYVIPPGHVLGAGIYNIGGVSALYGLGFTWAEMDMDFG